MRARGKSDSKTDRQTHRRIVQNHFSRRFGGCTSQIRSYLEVDFWHDANTSIDMEVICGLVWEALGYNVQIRLQRINEHIYSPKAGYAQL